MRDKGNNNLPYVAHIFKLFYASARYFRLVSFSMTSAAMS